MRSGSPLLSSLLPGADDAALLERVASLASALPITNAVDARGAEQAHPEDAVEAALLERDGYGFVRDAEVDARTAMTDAIDALRSDGLPATFVYLTDPVWALGERLRRRVSSLVGRSYRIIADAWAWRIEKGQRGWPPHRGWRTGVLDRRAPQLVNVWIALADVEAERSCMHAVPLDEDPGYPTQLDLLDGAPLQTVRALPVVAGTALFWNANLLHWGGPCAERAKGPRYSCSFSLVRDDALDLIGVPRVVLDPFDARARLDLVAAQIVQYGEGQPDVSAEVLEWARATSALARLAGSRKPADSFEKTSRKEG